VLAATLLAVAPLHLTAGSPEILNYMIEHENDILMELTPKTPADVKGGTVVEYEGHMRLLEVDMPRLARTQPMGSVSPHACTSARRTLTPGPYIRASFFVNFVAVIAFSPSLSALTLLFLFHSYSSSFSSPGGQAAQVPPDKVNEFKTVRKFGVFNTNNIWFDLRFVKTALERGELQLDIIANPKVSPPPFLTTPQAWHAQTACTPHVHHSLSLSLSLSCSCVACARGIVTLQKVREIPVLQLETAVGSSISCAHNPAVVCVPRSRFLVGARGMAARPEQTIASSAQFVGLLEIAGNGADLRQESRTLFVPCSSSRISPGRRAEVRFTRVHALVMCLCAACQVGRGHAHDPVQPLRALPRDGRPRNEPRAQLPRRTDCQPWLMHPEGRRRGVSPCATCRSPLSIPTAVPPGPSGLFGRLWGAYRT